jgi:hypothetical protein
VTRRGLRKMSTDSNLVIPSGLDICESCIYYIESSVFCRKGELESFGDYVKMGCQFHNQGSYMIRISKRFYDRTIKAKKEQYLITKSVSKVKALKIKGILEDSK